MPYTFRFFNPPRMVVTDCSKTVNTCNYRTYDAGKLVMKFKIVPKKHAYRALCYAANGLGWSTYCIKSYCRNGQTILSVFKFIPTHYRHNESHLLSILANREVLQWVAVGMACLLIPCGYSTLLHRKANSVGTPTYSRHLIVGPVFLSA